MTTTVLVPVSRSNKKAFIGAAFLALAASFAFATPSMAQLGATTVPTTPADVLNVLDAGAGDMDGIAGLAAAMGIGSTVAGAGALIFKRFVYL